MHNYAFDARRVSRVAHTCSTYPARVNPISNLGVVQTNTVTVAGNSRSTKTSFCFVQYSRRYTVHLPPHTTKNNTTNEHTKEPLQHGSGTEMY